MDNRRGRDVCDSVLVASGGEGNNAVEARIFVDLVTLRRGDAIEVGAGIGGCAAANDRFDGEDDKDEDEEDDDGKGRIGGSWPHENKAIRGGKMTAAANVV